MRISQRFEEMEVWKLARELTKCTYSISNSRLFFQCIELREQICREAICIVSNIAGGFESQSNPGFCRFSAAARGATAEIRAQLCLACDLGYISDPDFQAFVPKTESISRQITGFINDL